MADLTAAVDYSQEKKSLDVKIKQEKKDDREDIQKDSSDIKQFTADQHQAQLSQLQSRNVTITVAVTTTACGQTKNSTVQATKQAPPPPPPPALPPEPPPIDFSSIRGAFGWTTVGSVHLPFIMRGEEKFVAVRMVECKIISKYADILPWTVFTCTNIKSYYITENEAKLLNEINGYHCDFQFGYQTFSAKDVVVRLSDTVKFYEFLESCRTKLQPSNGNPLFKDQCGFVLVNMAPIPYVRKGSKKYVPTNMVQPEGMVLVIQTEKVTEWDLAYLRFLCFVASIDQRKVKAGGTLCALEELQNIGHVACFDEWWPNMQISSTDLKNGRPLYPQISPAMGSLSRWGGSISVTQQASPHGDDSQKLREKNEVHIRHSHMSPIMGLENYMNLERQPSHSPRVIATNESDRTASNNSGSSSLFPSSLEGLLSMPTTRDYHRPLSYQSHVARSEQTGSSMCEFGVRRHSATEGGLSALATSRPRPFPPPPPLVRLGGAPRTSHVIHNEHSGIPRPPTLHPYARSSVLPPTPSPSWLARALEAEWLGVNHNRTDILQQTNENDLGTINERLTQRLSCDEVGSSVDVTSNDYCLDRTVSSQEVTQDNNVLSSVLRNTDSSNHNSQLHAQNVEDRVVPMSSSPRPPVPIGPPPYYPTPPQSSPLQPLTVQVSECSQMPGMTDMYPPRTTPNGVIDLCSPPPSPETRNTLQSSSPRGHAFVDSHLLQSSPPSSNPAPHSIRLVQVDGRYVLAINAEPHNYNLLVIPVSVVATKFLLGTSTQSCQVTLERVFGVKLHECTRIQQETFAKHKRPVSVGSKLVSVADVRTYLYQLRLLVEVDKQKGRNCDERGEHTELPLAKRWCGNDRES